MKRESSGILIVAALASAGLWAFAEDASARALVHPTHPVAGFVVPKRPTCARTTLPAGSVGFTVSRVCSGFQRGRLPLFAVTTARKPRIAGKVELQTGSGDIEVQVFVTPQAALVYEKRMSAGWKSTRVREERVANVIALMPASSRSRSKVDAAMVWLGAHES